MTRGAGDIAKIVLEEPGVTDAQHYTRRVRLLALVHFALFFLSLLGFGLLVSKGEFFVTLPSARTSRR